MDAKQDWFTSNTKFMRSFIVRSKRNGYLSEFNLHKNSSEHEVFSRAIEICSYFRAHQFSDLEIVS